MGLCLIAFQGRVAAQGPLSTSGFLLVAEQEHGDEKDKKEHEEAKEHDEHEHHEPTDLRLFDFFNTGWTENFEDRERAGKAPRLNLFKTRQGFLEREATFNYGFERRADQGQFDGQEASIGFEYALNRRFEMDVEPFYTWKRTLGPRDNQSGLQWDLGTRFQLIDTEDTAVNFQLRVLTPQAHLDESQTTLAPLLAGFNDLTKYGLYRTGLYYTFEYDALIGPRGQEPESPGLAPGLRASSAITYSAALAKTLVDPEVPLVGDFTLFVEAFGTTNLNGGQRGDTYFSFTPGIRMNLAGREEKAWWLQGGVEIPVTGPRPFDMGVRISLIHDF